MVFRLNPEIPGTLLMALTPSAPPRMAAAAMSQIYDVMEASFAMTGLSVAERTHFVIISVAAGSLPMEAPPPAEWKAWEQEKFSSKPSTPACVNTFAALTQSSSLRLDVRIMEAKMGRSGDIIDGVWPPSHGVVGKSLWVSPDGRIFRCTKRGNKEE